MANRVATSTLVLGLISLFLLGISIWLGVSWNNCKNEPVIPTPPPPPPCPPSECPHCPQGEPCPLCPPPYQDTGREFEILADSNIANDPALPRLGETETTINECLRTCSSNPRCFGFGVEESARLQGRVKCWFMNTNNPSRIVSKPGSSLVLKTQNARMR